MAYAELTCSFHPSHPQEGPPGPSEPVVPYQDAPLGEAPGAPYLAAKASQCAPPPRGDEL